MSCCEGQGHTHNHERHREEAVEGLSEQELVRLRNERREKMIAEMMEHKKKYLPLLKFMKANGMKFKSAAFKKQTIEYFRMDQFKAFLEEKKDKIEANPAIKELLKNWQRVFFYYQRLANQPHLKWPQSLEQTKSGPESKFASFRFDSSESSKSFAILIVLGVIALVLFPLWPYEVKYLLWKLVLYFTVGIIAIIILRVVVYMFMSIFGVTFWILPRLFDDVTFTQSVKPLYSKAKWEGSSVYGIITRLLLLGIFFYYGYHIYADPGMVKQNLNITQTIIDDINDWGISKIKGEKNFSQSALNDYSKLLNQTIQQEPLDEDNAYKTIQV